MEAGACDGVNFLAERGTHIQHPGIVYVLMAEMQVSGNAFPDAHYFY